MRRTLANPQATEQQAACYAAHLGAGLNIYLCGELGAGKTTFARGLLRALGYRGIVRSPTYTLVETYDIAALRVHHLDLYRIADAQELEELGCREYFGEHSVCLVEWPERGAAFLPTPDLTVTLRIQGHKRQLDCQASTTAGRRLLAALQQTSPD